MFKCGLCGKTIPPRIKSKEVITAKRKKFYTYRQNANRTATWKEDKVDRIASQNDFGGQGWEAAETQIACPQCARKVEDQQA